MDEKRKAALRKYFLAASIVFSAVYVLFMMLMFFSPPVSQPVLVCLGAAGFVLIIVQNDVDEKLEEVEASGKRVFCSLCFFTFVIVLLYLAILYFLQTKRQESVLSASLRLSEAGFFGVMVLYDSILLGKTLYGLRRMKQ